ncbi:hypothetical protein DC347_17915 [Pseudarthrobacter sp. AG30]|uniref:hypothetical protein n=1 Tax=Pseudarthrobacter sp. AG30 TaxID=2249742 RepID=UPI000D6E9576|nr:hypothetical protein [Pseudarthrobacter sp. AG30]RAX15343.1 hypothetical protein DC347_17915 [Pseudarthrobacter sp. AG30]
MDEQQAVVAVAKALDRIPEENFTAWPGGWPDQIGMALVDAVFSIRAVYKTKDPVKGVLGRANSFLDAYPDAANDLECLLSLGEMRIRKVMGNGKTVGRYKSECIIEAACNFLSLTPPVRTAAHLRALDPDHKRAYTEVKGLGDVTYEYLTMLLGQPGIKADRMIRGFVDAALEEQHLAPVKAETARRIVAAVHAAERPDVELQKFDHAIWMYQRDLPKGAN